MTGFRQAKRRFIPISEAILDEAMKVAERVGIPYNILIEKILNETMKVMKYKPNVLDMLSMADSLDDIRRLGGIVLPWVFVKKTLDSMSASDFNELLKELSKISLWYGELARVKRTSSPGEFQRAISLWIPSSSIDVLSEEEGVYKFVVALLEASPRVIEVAKTIVSGLAKGYNLKIIEILAGSHIVTIRVSGFVEED